jgi:hypothetical protein
MTWRRHNGLTGLAPRPGVPARLVTGSCALVIALASPTVVMAADGAYGRLDGDLAFSIEAGVSEAWPGESLATRGRALYLQTAGVFVQYDDALGVDVQPLARSLVAGLELRPLFLARFAEDLERGPAMVDLWLDSFGIGLGVYRSWHNEGYCNPPGDLRPCRDLGMELSTGFELPLLPHHDGPFLGLRIALRWSLDEQSAAFDGPAPSSLTTLSLGYRHLFDLHLVDAADRLPP